MKIELRHRTLKTGNQSLYLEFYDGETKERYYESLNLFLIPERTDEDRRVNENTLKVATKMKAERILGITHPEERGEAKTSSRILIEWMDEYLHGLQTGHLVSAAYCNHMRSSINILKKYLTYIHRPRYSMAKVDKSFFKSFLAYLKDEYKSSHSGSKPKALSEKTMFLIQTDISTMFTKAVKDGVLKKNPFYELEMRDKFHKTDSDREFLTVDELNGMSKVETGSPETKRAFMFCCFTGLRYGDMKNLKWNQIKKTDSGDVVSVPSMEKTGHPVIVPLGDKAREWLPDRGEAKDEDNVFAKVSSLCNCNRVLKHMAKRAGINKVISFHCSRHTFATLTITAGADIYTTSKLLGHVSIHSTQIYADVIMDKRVNAVNLTNGLFD